MTILEILEAHRTLANSPRDTVCACDRTWRPHAEYRAHLAEVLDKYMQEAKAEAWDEGAEAEASAACMNPPCGVCDGCFTPVDNPYKETE